VWQTLAAAVFLANPAADDRGVSGTTRAAESQNFQVSCGATAYDARQVAQTCERWRVHLHAKWLGDESHGPWTPRCTVVIHSRREAYQAAIGRGSDRSFGSSWIDTKEGRISQRRIDLLVDSQGALSAFAHELTHVVLADAFIDSPPPLWANEGIAILSDSMAKQRLHRRDLNHSLLQQTAFHCAELTQLAAYPAPERVPAFYGQSAALVELLSDLRGPERLVPFLKNAASRGYDQALRETYGIAGLGGLQRAWLQHQSSLANAR
jgi:hypothetical protein